MGNSLHRLFIAVEAPPEVRAVAEGAIARLRPYGDVRWTPTQNLHLTLKFLGDTPTEKISAICKNLAEIANDFSVVVVRLGGPGAFPNGRRPQVLWLGFEEETPSASRLADLAKAIDSRMAVLGFPPETRAFVPHLTLGRVRSVRGLPVLAARLAEPPTPREPRAVAWPIREICLIESCLGPAGSAYQTVERWELASSDPEEE
jgi:2'-5' RNA ligase